MKRSEWGIAAALVAIVVGGNLILAVTTDDYWVRLLAGFLRYGLVMVALAVVAGLVRLYRRFLE